MSEDTQQAENESVDEPTTEEASPAAEEQTTQEDTTTEVEAQVDEPTEEEVPESKPKKNAESRIRELVKENKELKQSGSPDKQPPRGSGRFSDQFKGADNVTPEDLDRAAEQYLGQAANSIVDQRMQPLLTELQRDRLESDINKVQSDYPELNPESGQYDPGLDKAIADNYAEFGKAVRLSSFVDKQMKLAKATAERAKLETAETISQQSEETAVRPGTKSKAEAKFEDLSIDEMEAKLGQVH